MLSHLGARNSGADTGGREYALSCLINLIQALTCCDNWCSAPVGQDVLTPVVFKCRPGTLRTPHNTDAITAAVEQEPW